MKIAPQLATLVDDVPQGENWIHEIKFDGYRILCEVDRGRAVLFSRNGKDWTRAFQSVADAAAKLPCRRAVLDGEVVSLDGENASSFQNLQNALSGGGKARLAYYVFDLLELDGEDLTARPLHQRKAALAKLLGARARSGKGTIRYTAHLEGHGERLYQEACKTELEGIISKRRDRGYHPGRGLDWVKVKCHKEQELVIGGFTDPQGSRRGFGALLLGVQDDTKGGLRYAGKVGTGFTDASLKQLYAKLARLATDVSPFVDGPRPGARGVHFVRPELVAQVVFTEWTSDGHLRHPSFAGLREDKPARAVFRERARHIEEAAVSTQPVARPRTPRSSRPALSDGPTRVAGIALSHPHKILYRDQGVTKLELAQYYESVAERMLPHVAGRPLTLVRCPGGQGQACFYQKHAGQGAGDEINRVMTEPGQKADPYMMVDSVQGLVSLVQLGVLEVHVWGSRIPRLEHPDLIVMDLDPAPGVPWTRVVDGARTLRTVFAKLDLESFVKTTGGKGLHVVVPLTGSKLGWDDFKEFTKRVAERLVRDEPDRYTSNMSKEKRTGKIFVDYLRNGRGATAVAPYSSRAREGAPVALPVPWATLGSIQPDGFSIRNVLTTLARRRTDPWAKMTKVKQSLTKAMLKLLK